MQEDFARRIERLERLELARALPAQYAMVVDSGDAEAIAALFADDGILEVPGRTIRGRGPIREFFAERIGISERRHFVTNVVAEPEVGSDRVHTESYFLYVSREPGGSAIGWGRYTDVVEIAGTTAALISKTISPALFTTLEEGWPR